jgi:HEAT repeat protein
MVRQALFCLPLFALLLGGTAAAQQPADKPGQADEQILQHAKIATDDDALFQYLENHSLKPGDHEILKQMVTLLDSANLQTRKKAQADLVKRGELAIPYLKKAQQTASLELSRLLEQTLKEIDKGRTGEYPVAVARLLTARTAPKSAALHEKTLKALLNYLPCVTEEYAEDEVIACIARLGFKGGKLDPVLQTALKEEQADRRAAAAFIVAHFGQPALRDQLRQFLADKDEGVRLRTAAGLLGKRVVTEVPDHVAQAKVAFTKAMLPADRDALFKFLSDRTLSEADQKDIQTWIGQLGARTFAAREQATRRLIERGPLAVPLLRMATEDGVLEKARRAQLCIDKIGTPPAPTLPIAAARLLADLPEARAGKTSAPVQALLTYFPFADDETIEEELLTTLSLLNVRGPGVDGALVKALGDPLPLRRAAAGYVLGRVGTEAERQAARKLLEDPVPKVRLRVALGLLAGRDRQAVPALIELLRVAPDSWRWKAEEQLVRLAGAHAPPQLASEALGPDRAKAIDAWKAWWRDRGDGVDVAMQLRDDHLLGLYTIAEYDSFNGGNGQGRVWECGRDGKERWEIKSLFGAMDGQVLPNGNVLVAENSASRVSERDKKTGAVVWEYRVNNPVAVQRLPNGNTFIASYNQVTELRPDRSVAYSYQRGGYIIFGAQKLRNGNILYITSSGLIVEMDTTGKELKTLNVGGNNNWCSVELLPNGNYLVALMLPGEVREIDSKGTIHWKASFPGVFRATRLPNGNTVVASMTTRMIAELDRNGTRVFERQCNGRPWMVRYR